MVLKTGKRTMWVGSSISEDEMVFEKSHHTQLKLTEINIKNIIIKQIEYEKPVRC